MKTISVDDFKREISEFLCIHVNKLHPYKEDAYFSNNTNTYMWKFYFDDNNEVVRAESLYRNKDNKPLVTYDIYKIDGKKLYDVNILTVNGEIRTETQRQDYLDIEPIHFLEIALNEYYAKDAEVLFPHEKSVDENDLNRRLLNELKKGGMDAYVSDFFVHDYVAININKPVQPFILEIKGNGCGTFIYDFNNPENWLKEFKTQLKLGNKSLFVCVDPERDKISVYSVKDMDKILKFKDKCMKTNEGKTIPLKDNAYPLLREGSKVIWFEPVQRHSEIECATYAYHSYFIKKTSLEQFREECSHPVVQRRLDYLPKIGRVKSMDKVEAPDASDEDTGPSMRF